MTGEVTDILNEITLFGMALFWQKAIKFFTKFIIHFLTYRAERLLTRNFTAWQKAIEFFTNCHKIHFLTYRVEPAYLSRNFAAYLFYRCLSDIWRDMDCWVIGRCTAKLIGGRQLFDVLQLTSHLHDVNSVNKSSRS